MNFDISDSHRMMGDTLDRFARDYYPLANRTLQTAPCADVQSSRFNTLAGLGVIGALFPESDGGYGGEGVDIAVVFESLGRGLVSAPILGAMMAGRVIANAGSDAQKEILPGLIDGTQVAGWAHEEPGGHYELARVNARATRDSDSWHVTGRKSGVLYGEHAHWCLVTARTSVGEENEQGISLFLIPATVQGFTRCGFRCLDGSPAADLCLEDVRLPLDSLVGREGEGFGLLEMATAYGILALCAEAVGVMDRAQQATIEYLKTRRQFGVAIGSFQVLQHRMADVALEVEQARSAVINAAHAIGKDRQIRERTLSAAKYAIGRIGLLVAEDSIQMHGAIGMTWDAAISHYAKRLIMIDHQLGDEDHHLQRYIALGRQ